LEVVRELLARGAAVDTAMNGGYTPLHVASQEGCFEVVRELLARGASPGLAAHSGATALSSATANGHPAVSQLLRAALAEA
jgi:serine/threonine-protein phosphatase 6 regulatory ankyrin repeat subunit B